MDYNLRVKGTGILIRDLLKSSLPTILTEAMGDDIPEGLTMRVRTYYHDITVHYLKSIILFVTYSVLFCYKTFVIKRVFAANFVFILI